MEVLQRRRTEPAGVKRENIWIHRSIREHNDREREKVWGVMKVKVK